MKTIYSLKDLEEYGIIFLTGEACGYGYRLLCDVTEKGKALLEKALDVKLDLPKPWNASKNAVGSIMLPPGLLKDLMRLALLQHHDWVLIEENGICHGCSCEEYKEVMAERGEYPRVLQYRRQGDAAEGSRFLHRMTGRVY